MISSTLLFLSGPDITIIVIAALVLFGGKKIPEFARGLGQGIKEFKNGQEGTPPPTTNDTKEPKV